MEEAKNPMKSRQYSISPMKRTLIIVLFFCNYSVKGQVESDNGHLYVLLDVSGSMRSDVNNNSYYIVESLVNKFRNDSTFHLILFGEEKRIISKYGSAKELADRNKPMEKSKLDQLLSNVKKQRDEINDKRKFIRHTDINAALKELPLRKGKINGALIIVSDGLLKPGDVPGGINDQVYRDYLKENQNLFNEISINVPIFFIQTSTSKNRDFYQVDQTGLSNSSDQEILHVSHEVDLQNDSSLKKELDELFNRIYFTMDMNISDQVVNDSSEIDIVLSTLAVNEAIKHFEKVTDQGIAANNTKEVVKTEFEKYVLAEKELLEQIVKSDNMSRVDIVSVSDLLFKIQTTLKKEKGLVQVSGDRIYLNMIGSSETRIPDEVKKSNQGKNLEEALILGLTDYLIERVESEVSFVYYEQLGKILNQNTFIKDTLFYNTTELFGEFAPNTTPPTIPMIREAFTRDIQNLPFNLSKLPDQEEQQGLFFLKCLFAVLHRIQIDVSVEKVLASLYPLDSKKYIPDYQLGIAFVSQYFQFLLQHDFIEEIETGKVEEKERIILMYVAWFAKFHPEINQIKDIKNLVYRIALLNQKVKALKAYLQQIQLKMKVEPVSDFAGYNTYINQLGKEFVKETFLILKEGVELTRNFTQKPVPINKIVMLIENVVDGYFLMREKNYVQGTLLLTPIVFELSYRPELGRLLKNDKLLPQSKKLSNLVLNKERIKHLAKGIKEVKLVINDNKVNKSRLLDSLNLQFVSNYLLRKNDQWDIQLVESLNVLFKEVKAESLDFIAAYWKHLVSTKNPKSIEDLMSLSEFRILQMLVSDGVAIEKLKDVIQMACEVAASPSAEGVKKIISSYALPPASYRAKRQQPYFASINAYVGGGVNYYDDGSNVYKTIIMAPFGIDLSWNPRKSDKRMNSGARRNISLFISALDLGNVINYRFNESDPAQDDAIRWEQIVSPGAFITYPLAKRLPLSLMAGYQLYPNRTSISLTFDLPIFRLTR